MLITINANRGARADARPDPTYDDDKARSALRWARLGRYGTAWLEAGSIRNIERRDQVLALLDQAAGRGK